MEKTIKQYEAIRKKSLPTALRTMSSTGIQLPKLRKAVFLSVPSRWAS